MLSWGYVRVTCCLPCTLPYQWWPWVCIGVGAISASSLAQCTSGRSSSVSWGLGLGPGTLVGSRRQVAEFQTQESFELTKRKATSAETTLKRRHSLCVISHISN